jgi:hypothetical protein
MMRIRYLKDGKIKEDEDEVDHQAAHDEEEGQECALTMLQEPVDVYEMAERGDDGGGGDPEKIQPDDEQDSVQDARDQYPFPQAVLGNEVMRFDIGLEGYNYFFEQSAILLVLSD